MGQPIWLVVSHTVLSWHASFSSPRKISRTCSTIYMTLPYHARRRYVFAHVPRIRCREKKPCGLCSLLGLFFYLVIGTPYFHIVGVSLRLSYRPAFRPSCRSYCLWWGSSSAFGVSGPTRLVIGIVSNRLLGLTFLYPFFTYATLQVRNFITYCIPPTVLSIPRRYSPPHGACEVKQNTPVGMHQILT